MSGRRGALFAVVFGVLSVSAAAHADEDRPERIRIRHDTIVRFAPRYVLTVDESNVAARDRYWMRVNSLPIYERLVLDAEGLEGGTTDTHISAWGALDATMDPDAGLLAGDFAQAFVERRFGSVHSWAGRRFLAWGRPGGFHIDGGGASIQQGVFELSANAGRPVTTELESPLGGQTGFQRATYAHGVRAGCSLPGRLSAGVALFQQWAYGVEADRVLAADLFWRPHRRLDMTAGAVLDTLQLGVEQASLRATYFLLDPLDVEVSYAHQDPQRLLPSWSILSVFATGLFDEAGAAVTWRSRWQYSVRAEGGVRRSHVAAAEAVNGPDDRWWGYRAGGAIRWLLDRGQTQFILRGSHREDGAIGLNLLHAGASFPAAHGVRASLEAAWAQSDERDSSADSQDRASYLGRVSLQYPFRNWIFAATMDAEETPVVLAEVRGMMTASWRSSPGESMP